MRWHYITYVRNTKHVCGRYIRHIVSTVIFRSIYVCSLFWHVNRIYTTCYSQIQISSYNACLSRHASRSMLFNVQNKYVCAMTDQGTLMRCSNILVKWNPKTTMSVFVSAHHRSVSGQGLLIYDCHAKWPRWSLGIIM